MPQLGYRRQGQGPASDLIPHCLPSPFMFVHEQLLFEANTLFLREQVAPEVVGEPPTRLAQVQDQ